VTLLSCDILSLLCTHALSRALSPLSGKLGSIEESFLKMFREKTNDMLGASEMSTKFAILPELFDAVFVGFQEFLDGVAGHVGLPATNRMKGMGNNFCHGDAVHEKFTTPNYGGTQTTAAEEFELVVKPDLNKEYVNECGVCQ